MGFEPAKPHSVWATGSITLTHTHTQISIMIFFQIHKHTFLLTTIYCEKPVWLLTQLQIHVWNLTVAAPLWTVSVCVGESDFALFLTLLRKTAAIHWQTWQRRTYKFNIEPAAVFMIQENQWHGASWGKGTYMLSLLLWKGVLLEVSNTSYPLSQSKSYKSQAQQPEL